MNITKWIYTNSKWILPSSAILILSLGTYSYLLEQEIETKEVAIKQLKEGNLNDPIVREMLLRRYGLESIISDPSSKELFTLDGLDNVDISEKTIRIDIDEKFFSAFGDDWEFVLKDVLKFYNNGRIHLDFEIVDSIDYNVLKPGKHIAIVVLDAEEFNKIASDHTYGTVEFSKNVCYIPQDLLLRIVGLQVYDLSEKLDGLEKELNDLIKSEKEKTRLTEKLNEKLNPLPDINFRLSTVLLHELAHLFGLYHSNKYLDDIIPNKSDGLPNCMKPIDFESDPTNGCTFEDIQMKMMHSYLSGGKVFQAYKLVGFNTQKYSFLVGYVNKYSQPTK